MSQASNELSARAAIDLLLDRLTPVTAFERVALRDAHGRILASDLVAALDLPSFSNAAMDGYAVRSADCRAPTALTLVGAALAGHAYTGALPAGSAIRITTGAPLPADTDAVVMQEHAQRDGDRVSFPVAVSPGLNVRPRGEQVRAGDVVLVAGTPLHGPEIAMATAIGVTDVDVRRRLRVGVASTGDELLDPPSPLTATASYDANRALIAAACRHAGFTVADLGICKDRSADFAVLLDAAGALSLDALLVSGGTALGDADVVRKAEGMSFIPLLVRPGRGITFARVAHGAGDFALIGLPGNAVATFVMFHLVALPVLLGMGGAAPREPVHLPLPLAAELSSRPGVVEYLRGKLEHDSDARLLVRPLQQQGAGMVRTLVDGDVLIAAGPQPRYAAGELVPVVLLASLPR